MSITATGDRLEVIVDSGVEDQQRAPEVSAEQPAGDSEVPASARPTFTITDAATACSVSRKTITRKLPELAGHGAAKDDDGVWRIPVEALLAVGLHPGRSLHGSSPVARAAAPSPTPVRPAEQDMVTIPRDRWDDVRIRLARAEAEASERGLALADARLALRALTAGPVPDRALEGISNQDGGAPSGSWVAHPSQPATAELPASVEGARPAGQATMTSSGQDAAAPVTTVAAPAGSGDASADGNTSEPNASVEPGPADIVAARNLAARTGGYVPAVTAPVKKRRWWHSS